MMILVEYESWNWPPPPACFSNFPLLINVSFLVTSKDIQVEKGFATERAHQPHSQEYLPDVGTDSSPWGWWILFAIFNLALIYPFDAPNLDPKGLHVGWNGLLWSWGNRWRGRSSGLTYRFRDFRSCGLLKGWLGDGHTGGKMRLLYGRMRWDRVGVWCNSLQEPIETFCLWSCHHFPHLPPPLCLQLTCPLF